MKLAGWRGIITIEEKNNKKIATKSAKDASKKGAINKESQLISHLNKHSISFIPQLIDAGDGWFSYPWIEGDHFKDVYKNLKNNSHCEGGTTVAISRSPRSARDDDPLKKLVLQLLDRAYALDSVGIIHGELIRPFTNVLVTPKGEIAIIDFERGVIGDTSGKNMRSYAQWLLAEGRIDLPTTKSLGNMDRDEIYKTLKNSIGRDASIIRPQSNINTSSRHGHSSQISPGRIKDTSLRLFGGGYIAGLVTIDQATKYLFYTLERGSEYLLFTPIMNTGIGRSIPVPLKLVIILTIAICGGVIWGWQKKHLTTRTSILILAGAGGNLIDRVLFSGVRDFIDLQIRPIFNLADVYLTCAVLLLFYINYTDIFHEGH